MTEWQEKWSAIEALRGYRKVVGEKWVESEKIKKERKTKNTVTQTIVRTTVRHIVLECGHSIPTTEFGNPAKKKTLCRECAKEEYERSQK